MEFVININMAANTYRQSSLNKSRADKFRLVFQVPAALRKINKRQERSNDSIIENSLQFAIYGSIVPPISVPAIQIRYAGSTLYNSSHSKEPFPPVTVSFTIDNEYNNYWVIYKWLDLLHNEKTGLFDQNSLTDDGIFNDYQTDISIFGLDEFDNQRIEFKYVKAFPTTLGDITYNYREGGEIESSFTFVYSQLHTELLAV
jgi:hypothetical protein